MLKETYRGINIYHSDKNASGIKYNAIAVNGDNCRSDTLAGIKKLLREKEYIGYNY